MQADNRNLGFIEHQKTIRASRNKSSANKPSSAAASKSKRAGSKDRATGAAKASAKAGDSNAGATKFGFVEHASSLGSPEPATLKPKSATSLGLIEKAGGSGSGLGFISSSGEDHDMEE